VSNQTLVLDFFWRMGPDAFVDGAVKGFVKGFKNLVSSNPPPQQQPQQTVTTQTQQPSNNASNNTLNLGAHTIPLVLRIPSGTPNPSNTNVGTSNQNTKPRLGPFNGAYPISPPSPSDDDTANQNKPKLGPFNGAYPISPLNQLSTATPQNTATVPSQSTAGPSNQNNQNNKPRLGPFNGAYPISPLSPTDGGTGNQDNKPKLGPFNGAYPISLPPTKSISSGSSVLQTPNDTTPGTTPDTTPDTTMVQTSATKPDSAWTELSNASHSTDSLSYASGDETGAVPGENGDGEEVDVDDADGTSISCSIYPPSTAGSEQDGTCMLKGCSNPTFVDPITDLESEYCSWKHQE